MAAAALRMLTPVGRRAVPGPAPPGSGQPLGDRGAEAGRATGAHYILLVPGARPRRARRRAAARSQALLRQPRTGAGRDAADDRPDAGPHQDPDHRAVCAPRPGFGQGLRGPGRRQHRRRHPAAGEARTAAAVTPLSGRSKSGRPTCRASARACPRPQRAAPGRARARTAARWPPASPRPPAPPGPPSQGPAGAAAARLSADRAQQLYAPVPAVRACEPPGG